MFERRGGPQWSFLAHTSDPDRALQNLLTRDTMFTARLREEAGRLRVPVIDVDFGLSEDELVCRVARLFGLE